MNSYAIYFDYKKETYRLPVNPDEIKRERSLATGKYEVLGLGQIIVPKYAELMEYSFECELPHKAYHYVETPNGFKDADYYLNLFENWRNNLIPVRFIATNGIGDNIDTLVLIEKISDAEKAGEEGDRYVSFSLVEYKTFGWKESLEQLRPDVCTPSKVPPADEVNPKSSGSYTVQRGDTLWAIAKKYYGDGSKYPKIYNANTDKIKNPSLIYAGQILTIPN